MKLPSNDVSALIEVLAQCVIRNDYRIVKTQPLSNRFDITQFETEQLLGFLIELVKKSIVWSSHSEVELKQNLHDLGFKDDWVNALNAIILKAGQQKTVSNCMVKIERLVWRIDISLCDGSMKRAMSPTVLWNVRSNDGRRYTVEISIRKFHELRFNVASILKEMFVLNDNSLVKKINE